MLVIVVVPILQVVKELSKGLAFYSNLEHLHTFYSEIRVDYIEADILKVKRSYLDI